MPPLHQVATPNAGALGCAFKIQEVLKCWCCHWKGKYIWIIGPDLCERLADILGDKKCCRYMDLKQFKSHRWDYMYIKKAQQHAAKHSGSVESKFYDLLCFPFRPVGKQMDPPACPLGSIDLLNQRKRKCQHPLAAFCASPQSAVFLFHPFKGLV